MERSGSTLDAVHTANARGSASVHVVLADDHGPYRDGLADAIANHAQLELAEAVSDGELALAAVRRHRPDVALLDVRMPGTGGLEAARQLRDGSTAVVLLSGNTSAALAREASTAGALALMDKGLSRGDICRRLVELARG